MTAGGRRRAAIAGVLGLLAAACGRAAPGAPVADDQWPAYAGAGGARFSALDRLTTKNVSGLKVAWTYRTGELGQGARDGEKLTFEATPILSTGRSTWHRRSDA